MAALDSKIHIVRQALCQRNERRLVDPALAMTLITGQTKAAVWSDRQTYATYLLKELSMNYLNPRAIAIDTPMPPPAWALLEWN